MRSRDQLDQLLAGQHDIARIERHLQRGDLGAGHRPYLTRELREREAIATWLREEYSQLLFHLKAVEERAFKKRAVKERAVKENPFLKALRANGVQSLREMADKTGKLEKKGG